MKRIRITPLVFALVLGVALWLGYRVLHSQLTQAPVDSPPVWESVFTHPVRSLAVVESGIVLGTYGDSYFLHPDATLAHLRAEPASSDSPWTGTVFALAADARSGLVYEGRDGAYEIGRLDLRNGTWQRGPGFDDAERWTVWSLAVGDALYAGTGKGVWMHPLEPKEGDWQLIGPPSDQARLPVFSLLLTEEGVYAGTFDGIWRYAEGEWQWLADGPRGKVLALAQLAWKGQSILAAGTGDGLFLQRDGGPWRQIHGDAADDPVAYSLAFDPKRGLLFVGTADGVVRLDLSADGESARFERAGLAGPIMALAWKDGTLVAGGDGGAYVWREGGK